MTGCRCGGRGDARLNRSMTRSLAPAPDKNPSCVPSWRSAENRVRMHGMTASIEDIESRIAFLEQANSDLSELVYRQHQELDALRAQVARLSERLTAAAAEAA